VLTRLGVDDLFAATGMLDEPVGRIKDRATSTRAIIDIRIKVGKGVYKRVSMVYKSSGRGVTDEREGRLRRPRRSGGCRSVDRHMEFPR
jgi:hypothetical protein